MRLSSLQIERLPIPATGQKTYFEGGFGVRVTKNGTKSFVVMYGKQRRLKTIGRYPAMNLKIARREAQTLLSAQHTETKSMTLTEAKQAFLADCEHRLRPKTVSGYTRYLTQCSRRYPHQVKRDDIDLSSPHCIAAWKAFFNWCLREELVERNPWEKLSTVNGTRDRVLRNDELIQVWHYNAPVFGDHLKLMLLTGLRRGETSCLKRDEDIALVPDHISKNGRTHRIPITPMVNELLPVDYFNGWSNAKRLMDEQVQIPHWTLHDLRRTFATTHAKIGTPIHIVEAMLNHASGTISGVAAIYIRHNFLAEARTAQLAYEEHLKGILDV